MTTVGLVACAKRKLDHAAPARRLYTSDLFQKAAAYCETHYEQWFVLSAKYGLVHPDTVIEPYDETLNRMPAAERRRWGVLVQHQLAAALPDLSTVQLYVHAGELYRELLGLETALGHWLAYQSVQVPLEHLGIGQQRAWYTRQAA